MGESFSNHLTKGQYSESTKNLNKFARKKPNNPFKKWAKDMKRHFSKKDIHVANKHIKESSSSPVIREMEIKTTMRYHLMLVRMAIIKKLGNSIPAWNVEK